MSAQLAKISIITSLKKFLQYFFKHHFLSSQSKSMEKAKQIIKHKKDTALLDCHVAKVNF